MAKDPAFLFYSQDFIVGVQTLTFEDRGKYITILAMMHQQGRMKEETIRFLVGSVSDNLKNKFSIDENGNWYNQRLEIETEKRNKFTQSRRNNGVMGGRPPKNSKPNENHMDNHMGNHMGNENENENENENKELNKVSENFSKDTSTIDSIARFFSISEQTNFQVFKLICRFVFVLEREQKVQDFKIQFAAYKKFKSTTGSAIHNVKTFMGYDKENYNLNIDRGAWCECDWVNRLSKLDQPTQEIKLKRPEQKDFTKVA